MEGLFNMSNKFRKPDRDSEGIYSVRMSDKRLQTLLKPIIVPRLYKPNDIIAGTTYYTSDTEQILLNKYGEICGGEFNKYPPMVIRNTQGKDLYAFTTIEMSDIVGTIIKITPTAFVVEPIGPTGKKLLETAIADGYKAAYEFIAPRITTTLECANGKTVDVLEITPRSRIICVNMIKR